MNNAAALFCVLMLSASEPVPSPWSGLYVRDSGDKVGIGEFHEFGKSEILVDYASGEVRPIVPSSDGKAGLGEAIGNRTPASGHQLERSQDGLVLNGQRLRRFAIRRESFRVTNGAVQLAGECLLPPHPPQGVVILIHGSGDGPRRAYDLWTNFFVSEGWVAIVYDKRGSGESTGDWHDANFIVLAEDAGKVVAWAREQTALRGLRLGLWGASQAGWIIPQLAAARAIDFAIMQAGPAIPSDDFIRTTLASELQAYGFSAEEIARAQQYYALDVAVSRGEAEFAAIQAAYEKAVAAGAEWILKPPDPAGAPDRRFIAAIAGFDPAPYWRQVRIPFLAIFGGKDHVVPAARNRDRLANFFKAAKNDRGEIAFLPEDNHLNMLAQTGVRTEYASLTRFDPKYFDAMRRFLARMSKAR